MRLDGDGRAVRRLRAAARPNGLRRATEGPGEARAHLKAARPDRRTPSRRESAGDGMIATAAEQALLGLYLDRPEAWTRWPTGREDYGDGQCRAIFDAMTAL